VVGYLTAKIEFCTSEPYRGSYSSQAGSLRHFECDSNYLADPNLVPPGTCECLVVQAGLRRSLGMGHLPLNSVTPGRGLSDLLEGTKYGTGVSASWNSVWRRMASRVVASVACWPKIVTPLGL